MLYSGSPTSFRVSHRSPCAATATQAARTECGSTRFCPWHPPGVSHSLRGPAPSASQREAPSPAGSAGAGGRGLPASPCSRDLASSGGLQVRPRPSGPPSRYQGRDGHLGPQSQFTLSDGREVVSLGAFLSPQR